MYKYFSIMIYYFTKDTLRVVVVHLYAVLIVNSLKFQTDQSAENASRLGKTKSFKYVIRCIKV